MKRIFKVFSLVLFMFIFIIKVSAVTITTNNSVSGTVDTSSKLVTNTGTLSITNVDSGDTFAYYKVLDVFYNSTTNNITYEFTSGFKTFLNSTNGQSPDYHSLTVAQYQALTSGNISNGYTTTTSSLDILLSKYASYIKTNNVTGTNMTVSSTTASATVAAGSYLVLPTSTQSVYAVMAGNVEFTGGGFGWTLNNATIVAKKSSPSITKEVYDFSEEDWGSSTSWFNNSYGTSYLSYRITLTIPTYPTNATNKTLTFEDTLPSGITFSGALDGITVNINGNNYYPDSSTGNINFDPDYMPRSRTNKDYGSVDTLEWNKDSNGIISKSAVVTGANASYDSTNNKITITFNADYIRSNTITIEYNAYLNDNATLGSTGNTNTAKMTYSNNPYGSGTTYVTDTATVYTYGIKVLKKNSNNTPLPGAQILLCVDNACSDYFSIWDATENDYVPLIATTDANGYATFTGLPGFLTYYYQEVKAPNGYRLDSTIYSVTVDTTQAYTTANLVNVPLGLLPATGGVGTYIYTGVGALMIIGALVILFVRNKKKK